MSLIEVSNLKKSFGTAEVLRGLSFGIEPGEQVAIQGASGSGKSTMLYILGGLDTADQGDVVIDGIHIHTLSDDKLALFRNHKVGFVFQFHFLLPSMKCIDNILLPAKIGNVKESEVKKRVLELADHLGVTHCLTKYPFEISGGEQQRINIIRALSLKPKLLLCDEPTGNLDSVNSAKVTNLLKDLSHELNTTLMVVTHNISVAASFERKITIEDGQIIS